MARSSRKRPSKVIARCIETPRDERAHRRGDERDADEEDDQDEIEAEEFADLQLQGVDGLSTEELRKFTDAMRIWNQLTPDARSALNSLPLQTVARADELTHEDQVTRIASLIDKYIEPCFDRETFDMYRALKNLCDERPEFWSRLFAGIRPERQEMLPSVAQYEHMRLLDLRPIKPVGDVEQALKSKPRDQALDDLLFQILSKPMAPLHRMIIPTLELSLIHI